MGKGKVSVGGLGDGGFGEAVVMARGGARGMGVVMALREMGGRRGCGDGGGRSGKVG